MSEIATQTDRLVLFHSILPCPSYLYKVTHPFVSANLLPGLIVWKNTVDLNDIGNERVSSLRP